MNHTRRRFLALGSAGAAAAVAAPARAAIPGLAQQLVIGVCVPLSGQDAHFGEQIADGVRAAVDQANREVGMLDHSFGIRTFDDENAIASALLNAQFAGDDPSVIAVVGHLSGVVTNATLQTYANARMPLIVPASSADVITSHGYRNVFRLPTKDTAEGMLFAHHIASLPVRPRKAIAVAQDGDYGYEVARGFSSQAATDKLPAELYVFGTNPRFADVAKHVADANPDYIFLAGTTEAMGPLVPALRAAGYKGAFGASQGFYNTQTLQRYAHDLGDALVSTSMPPLDRVPLAFRSLSALRARFAEITPLIAFGFAAAELAITVSRRTGSADRASIVRALSTGSYDTLVGSYTFGLSGDPIDPNVYFYNISDGRFKYAGAAHSSSFLL